MIGLPHIWVMFRGTLVPLCKFCEISSLDAQKTQPETQGAGPCPVRNQ